MANNTSEHAAAAGTNSNTKLIGWMTLLRIYSKLSLIQDSDGVPKFQNLMELQSSIKSSHDIRKFFFHRSNVD